MIDAIALMKQYGTNHYERFPDIVVASAHDVFVYDTASKCYYDFSAGYSSVNTGHCNYDVVHAHCGAVRMMGVVPNAYTTETHAQLLERLYVFAGQDRGILVSDGVDAVEAAIKIVLKWTYKVKKVPQGQAEIIVCNGGFHGRTGRVTEFFSDKEHTRYFGPYSGMVRFIPFGDVEALEAAITPHTAGFLTEPMQGEGGIHIPPRGYLRKCQEACLKRLVPLIVDEIQTGLGRTGKRFACDWDGVRPDIILIGKSLGGGMSTIAAALGCDELMEVLEPGDHGSTHGGMHTACATALAVLDVLEKQNLAGNAHEIGSYLFEQLSEIKSPLIHDVRGIGLFLGVKVAPEVKARTICERLLKEEPGVLTVEAQDNVVRFTPPLTITRGHIDKAMPSIARAFQK